MKLQTRKKETVILDPGNEMAQRHFKSITEISANRMAKAFGLAQTFFRRLDAIDHPESRHHIINRNYTCSGHNLRFFPNGQT